MRKFIIVLMGVLGTLNSIAQTKKTTVTASKSTFLYEIPVKITPYKNTKIYMGSYYGKSNTLIDSVILDQNSSGVFKGTKKLVPGIYFMVSPTYSILFEFLMDAKQHFSIVADTLNPGKAQIIGSLDNDIFKQYTAFSIAKGKQIQELNSQLSTATTAADSAVVRKALIATNNELQAYRNNLIKTNPNALLSVFFKAMKQPETPAIPVVNGKADSLYPYRFVKDHFWDDVNFNDDRLLRTPFFETKLDDYFKRFVVPDADSIYAEVKYMLLMARTGKEIYPYLLTKFTNKYINPEYMGQDKVFLKMFEDFYAKGDTVYISAAGRKTLFERAYSIMANQIGSAAPALLLTDTAGRKADLYSVKSKFVFVVFWDPTCGHCKEEIPRLDSIYQAKWKGLGVSVFSVNVNEPKMDEFKKFIHEKKLSTNWIQAYQTKTAREEEAKAGLPNFRQLFDIYKTPTMYLLDEKKQIIAKQLSLEQFDELLEAKLKVKSK